MTGQGEPSELLRSSEVARMLGFHTKTLAAWRASGRGPAFHRLPSGRIWYRRTDVEAWLESHRVGSRAAS